MEIFRTVIGYLEIPLAISFLLGGLVKLIVPGNARALEKTAPALLIRQFGLKRFARPAVRVLGASEALLALAIFLVGSVRIVSILTLILCAAALGTVVWGKLKFPEASCGCLGAHSSRIDFKSTLRIVGFFFESLALVILGTTWDTVPNVHDGYVLILAMVPAAVAILVLVYFWRDEFRSVRLRIVISTRWHRFAATFMNNARILDKCESDLIGNRRLYKFISSRVMSETGIQGSSRSANGVGFFGLPPATMRWKDKCWCFISYDGTTDDGLRVSVVAAFHIVGRHRLRISLIDESAKTSMLLYDSITKNFIPEVTDDDGAEQVLEILDGKVRIDTFH